jgi:hypothetical protein
MKRWCCKEKLRDRRGVCVKSPYVQAVLDARAIGLEWVGVALGVSNGGDGGDEGDNREAHDGGESECTRKGVRNVKYTGR